MHLYREKKNLDYPVLPQEIVTYLYSGSIYKIFLNPLIMIEVIFARHKDKELATAAKKVRILYLTYIGVLVFVLLIFCLMLFSS